MARLFMFVFIALALVFCKVNADRHDDGSAARGWQNFGGSGLLNWGASTFENRINANNVASIVPLWNFTITQAMVSTIGGSSGGWSSRCTSTGGMYLYCTSWSGGLYAFNRYNGQQIWFYNVTTFLVESIGNNFVWPGNEYASRTAPTIDGDNLYIATRAGAYLLAVNRFNGVLSWSTQIDANPFAYITSAVRVYNGKAYVGVASGLEDAVSYGVPCCNFRGKFVAVNTRDGSLVWTFYTIPDNMGQYDSWGGGSVWSSLAPIDIARNQIIISTGNLYSVPQYVKECLSVRQNYSSLLISEPCRDARDYSESIVALDLDTGSLRWAYRAGGIEVWNTLCGIILEGIEISPPDLSACPSIFNGTDFDFGQAPIFVKAGPYTPDGQDALVVCQKSGICHCISAQSGTRHWIVQAAPPGGNGGFEFGSATDGINLYYGDCNSNGLNFTLQNGNILKGISHFGAIDISSGRIVWETPLPIPYPGAGLMQGVTYANGVVYGGTLAFVDLTPTGPYSGPNNTGGHFYALNAATGQVLVDMKLDSKSCYAPSIIDGIIYVPCGYAFDGGLFPVPATLYAFGLPNTRYYNQQE